MRQFELPIRVAATDLDVQGHVNNAVYLRYVQDAAVAHWRVAAPAELQAALSWVVRRHEIDYLKPAGPGDELVARTWVGEPSGATWERFTELVRPADGAVVAKARTVWVAVDPVTRRPRRVGPEVVAPFRGAAG